MPRKKKSPELCKAIFELKKNEISCFVIDSAKNSKQVLLRFRYCITSISLLSQGWRAFMESALLFLGGGHKIRPKN